MVDLNELAARAVAEPTSRPRAMADLRRRVHQRSRRRVASGLAAASLVFFAGAGAGAWLTYEHARPGDVIVTGPLDGGDPGPCGPEEPVIVFVMRDITVVELDGLAKLIGGHPHVADWCFMDREASNQEFRQRFERNVAMMEWLDENPEGVPLSFRIEPVAIDQDATHELVSLLEQAPGVFEVNASPHR